MARPRNPEAVKLVGFPAGVNNVAPDQDLPTDEFGRVTALREAVNVDLVGPKKKPRIRHGYTLRGAGRFHSPGRIKGRGIMVAVRDGDLVAFDSAGTEQQVIRAGVGNLYLTYAQVNDDLYWSSSTELRRIRGADLADMPGWIGNPGTPAAEAATGGSLPAATYRIAVTWLDAEGHESGADSAVEVEAEGAIRVFNIPGAPEQAVTTRLYMSPPDGKELYQVADVSPLVTQVVINGLAEGKALETLWRQPLPPCETLRFWNGRLLGASANLLVWSDALRFGLTTHDNYMRFGQRITMLEPIGEGGEGSGCFVADHKNTYWLDGAVPGKWRRLVKYDHPAVPGTSMVVKGTAIGLDTPEPVAFWLAANGTFCAGLPGGTVRPLTEQRLALPQGERGASLYREYDGLRQLLTSFITTAPNVLAVGDRASASVIPYNTPA